MTLIAAGAIVLDSRVCRPGWLETSGGRILACGPGAPPRRADHEFADGVVHESLNGQVARQLEGPKAEKTKPIRKPAHGAVDAGTDEEAALAAGLALGLQE